MQSGSSGRCVDARRRVLGEEHPGTLAGNLVASLSHQAKYTEAPEEMLQATLEASTGRASAVSRIQR